MNNTPLVTTLSSLLLSLPSFVIVSPYPPPNPPFLISAVSPDVRLEQRIYTRTTRRRQILHLSPFWHNAELSTIARTHSQNYANGNRNYQTITNQSLRQLANKIPYQKVEICQIYHYELEEIAESNSFLISYCPEIEEEDYHWIGVGVVKNQNEDYYVTIILLQQP